MVEYDPIVHTRLYSRLRSARAKGFERVARCARANPMRSANVEEDGGKKLCVIWNIKKNKQEEQRCCSALAGSRVPKHSSNISRRVLYIDSLSTFL